MKWHAASALARAEPFWVKRAAGRWTGSTSPISRRDHRRSPYRVAPMVEQRILKLAPVFARDQRVGRIRRRCGPEAWLGSLPCPSRTTINRVLRRHGVFDSHARQRYPAPPRGWYLPDVAAGTAELDSFDFIEDLKLVNGPLLSVFTGTSVHGSLISAWPATRLPSATSCCDWSSAGAKSGLPVYAQFDNDTRFQGTPRWPHSIGWVSRLCLALDVVPVFAPPREPGFQNQIESLNGLWQSKVWGRWQHRSLRALQQRSIHYVTEHRLRSAARIDSAPVRRAFPSPWQFDPHAVPRGRLIFLRRTDATGRLRLLGQTWFAATHWIHRLVRCEVDLIHHQIALYALRRRQPDDQPLLATLPYHRPSLLHEEHTEDCSTITEPSPLSYIHNV